MIAADLESAGSQVVCCHASPCTRESKQFAQWVLPDGSESFVCPVRLVDEGTIWLFSLHDHYRNGIMPVAGGLLNQTAFYIDTMNYLDSIRTRKSGS